MTMGEHGPSRLVDRNDYGWYLTMDGAGSTGYQRDDNRAGAGGLLTFAEVERDHGPVRPVEPISDVDQVALVDAFRTAGRKTITTLAAAVELVFHRRRVEHVNQRDSYDAAKRALTAGRAGSWESVVLIEVMLFGNGLNLVRPKGMRNASPEVMRAAGPSRRVNAEVRDTLADMIYRWVTDPARYTEVAETLAWQVSAFADSYGTRGGWLTVADQWLMPGGLASEDIRSCYRLFYSLSEHFDPDVL